METMKLLTQLIEDLYNNAQQNKRKAISGKKTQPDTCGDPPQYKKCTHFHPAKAKCAVVQQEAARNNDASRAVVHDSDMPFAQGVFRWVANGTYTEGKRKDEGCVVKWFKSSCVYESEFYRHDIAAIDKAIQLVSKWNALGILDKPILVNRALQTTIGIYVLCLFVYLQSYRCCVAVIFHIVCWIASVLDAVQYQSFSEVLLPIATIVAVGPLLLIVFFNQIPDAHDPVVVKFKPMCCRSEKSR